MVEFTDLDYNDRVKNGLVLVELGAAWCGPCKALKPLLAQLSTEYTGQVVFGEVDVDKCPEVSKRLQIRNVPTIALYKNGTIVEKGVGLMDKSKLKAMIDKHLN